MSIATFWFEHVKNSVSDWISLVERLKKDFLVSDFQDEVWNQIISGKQGRTQPVVIFIVCMKTFLDTDLNYFSANSSLLSGKNKVYCISLNKFYNSKNNTKQVS